MYLYGQYMQKYRGFTRLCPFRVSASHEVFLGVFPLLGSYVTIGVPDFPSCVYLAFKLAHPLPSKKVE